MEMSKEQLDFIVSVENNELYQKSTSIHKKYQYHRFHDSETGALLNGQQVRREDKNGLIEGEPGFDDSSSRVVIYNFFEGVITNDGTVPGIEYPGHWEYWENGHIVKVVSAGGDTEEIWENGVPVSIENGLAEKRKLG